MSFNDPIYEEVHRRLMAQNKITHDNAKHILDRLLYIYEVPEDVVITPLSLTATQVLGLCKYKDVLRQPINPDQIQVAGIDVNGSSFCRLTAEPKGTFIGTVNLEFFNLTGRPGLPQFRYEPEKPISGPETEDNWSRCAKQWDALKSEALFRIRLDRGGEDDEFFVSSDDERECVSTQPQAFLAMTGDMVLGYLREIQEWLTGPEREGLNQVTVETFMPDITPRTLSFKVHPTVVENSRKEQRDKLWDRNLQRLVNVLRIFPREAPIT